jgi:hypothetical protein
MLYQNNFTCYDFGICFFFEQGKDPEGSRAALIGGVTYYKANLKGNKNYKQVHCFYRKNPIRRSAKAIRSFSTEEDDGLDTTAVGTIAGDYATWRQDDEGC